MLRHKKASGLAMLYEKTCLMKATVLICILQKPTIGINNVAVVI